MLFIRGTLLLFHPFRNEYKEITTQDLRIKYEKVMENDYERAKLESQIDYYQPYQALLDGIEEYIRQQREEDQFDENDDVENDEQYDNQEDDDLELETTEMNDINDFIKKCTKECARDTGLMDKESLLDRIGMLNIQQRAIFDDIVARLKSGNFVDEQFLIYIRYFVHFHT